MTARLGAGGGLSHDARLVLELFSTAGSETDLRSLLAQLVKQVRTATGAAFGVAVLIGRDHEVKELAADGVAVDALHLDRIALTSPGVLRRVLVDGVPVRLDLPAGPEGHGLPPAHPAVGSFLGAPVLVGGDVRGLIYLGNNETGGFTAADEELLCAIGRSLATVIEHARAEEESELRRAWVEASAHVCGDLPALRREDTLARLVTSVREVTGSELVALLDGDEVLEIGAVSGDPHLVAEIVEELYDVIVETGRTGRVGAVRRARGSSTLLVPLRTQIAPPGLLLVERAVDRCELSGMELDMLTRFSERAGLAVDHAYAVAQRHHSLLTADRNRIARDLHDLVIQRLFATGLHLQGARTLADDSLRDRIDRTITDLDASIRDIRSIIFELHHGAKAPLKESVQEVIAEYVPILGFAPVLRCSGAVDLAVDSASAEHVVATLREALSNVARHAGATNVYVELEASSDVLTLRVSDDGTGLPSDVDSNRSGGLVNARERAEAMGGDIAVVRRQPRGTCLEWWVPVTG